MEVLSRARIMNRQAMFLGRRLEMMARGNVRHAVATWTRCDWGKAVVKGFLTATIAADWAIRNACAQARGKVEENHGQSAKTARV